MPLHHCDDGQRSALPKVAPVTHAGSVRRFKPVSLPPALRSQYLLVCIEPHQVGLFRFLLEAYDNLALFTVIDKHVASLKLLFSPHQEKEVRAALAAMQQTVLFTVQEWPFRD